MATLFNNHPYISSSKFSANWRATAAYVGMVEGSCHLHLGTNQSAYDVRAAKGLIYTYHIYTSIVSTSRGIGEKFYS